MGRPTRPARRRIRHQPRRDHPALLLGYADPLNGPLGPNQFCYAGPAKSAATYDPQKAKALLAEAGYANGGPEIDYYSSTGRYISDRQISEAIAQMLTQVGFKVRLRTPEWANLWADVRNGKTPMYYMGRGQVADPAVALSQYLKRACRLASNIQTRPSSPIPESACDVRAGTALRHPPRGFRKTRGKRGPSSSCGRTA